MERYLFRDILTLALKRRKMAFISGPRQVGKTTLSKQLQKEFKYSTYKNWDESQFRRLWTRSPNQVAEHFDLTRPLDSRLLILDEIHKSKGWKQKLKGIFDHLGDAISIIVTGSARLNIFKKGGDSLMGRYLSFRLHPLSYGEVSAPSSVEPEAWLKSLERVPQKPFAQEPLERLFRMSGFPEPYFEDNPKVLNIWRRGRVEKIVREDLRDLSRLPELSQVEMLVSLLPSKVGSPLSVQSLREDLEVAHDTVKRWLVYLNQLYYFFEVRPWTKSVVRTLKKEPKIYLYDWTEIESQGARFENMVAVHLQKACDYWTDCGLGLFQLFYLRNKEKQEIDFLLAKDGKPWLAVEVKYADKSMDQGAVEKLTRNLKCKFVQVVYEPAVHRMQQNHLLISANQFFAGLP